MMQERDAESKAAKRPQRDTAMYLRELGISHMKKKLGFSLKSSPARSAEEGLGGGGGSRVLKYWLKLVTGAKGTSSSGCIAGPNSLKFEGVGDWGARKPGEGSIEEAEWRCCATTWWDGFY
jgi:hypothetical protein